MRPIARRVVGAVVSEQTSSAGRPEDYGVPGTTPDPPATPQLPDVIEECPPVIMYEVVFPDQTNHHGTLFGGAALALMDKAAFVAATRRARCHLVTVATDRVEFHAPARPGDIVEIVAQVVKVGRTSLQVQVRVTAEELLSGARRSITAGVFSFVALGDDGRPAPIAAHDPQAAPGQ